jgi:hypothetical protein
MKVAVSDLKILKRKVRQRGIPAQLINSEAHYCPIQINESHYDDHPLPDPAVAIVAATSGIIICGHRVRDNNGK